MLQKNNKQNNRKGVKFGLNWRGTNIVSGMANNMTCSVTEPIWLLSEKERQHYDAKIIQHNLRLFFQGVIQNKL